MDESPRKDDVEKFKCLVEYLFKELDSIKQEIHQDDISKFRYMIKDLFKEIDSVNELFQNDDI
ncbi:hypothetical protein [Bacillus sp. V5-8f]|uniref:hypothetical protein n=1 Tax=Bacillus sp. V5-8f TaxID=2053044 RepID=UPI000C776DEC|nr:hypothetical protein [Bacillus sp. V5-8f]PLT32008.1 hypothetical protein CUU64_20710 [Bacillus sp. V5-8f]